VITFLSDYDTNLGAISGERGNIGCLGWFPGFLNGLVRFLEERGGEANRQKCHTGIFSSASGGPFHRMEGKGRVHLMARDGGFVVFSKKLLFYGNNFQNDK